MKGGSLLKSLNEDISINMKNILISNNKMLNFEQEVHLDCILHIENADRIHLNNFLVKNYTSNSNSLIVIKNSIYISISDSHFLQNEGLFNGLIYI